MRLDKFLKVSRIIKRRTVAREAVLAERVLVNYQVAKPGTKLSVGDIIEINYFKKKIIVEVKSLEKSIRKEEAKEMYEIIEIKQ